MQERAPGKVPCPGPQASPKEVIKMNRLIVVLFAFFLTVGAPRQSPAQAKPGEKDQTIKLSTELIEVRAVVTDRQGKLIDGLTKEDFEVLENGLPQAISFFSIGRVAGKGDRVSVADNQALKTGRVSPQESPARTVALFADTLHLSTIRLLAMKQALRRYVDQQNLTGALQKALDNNRIYYSLAYYPSGANEKKPFRQLAVKVKTHPEYKVRTQKGYLASELAKEKKDEQTQTPQQRLVRALVAPLPVTTLGLVVEADYLESAADASQVSLQVSIDGEGLEYRELDGRYVFALDVTTMVFDASGNRVDGRSETINGNLLPERLALAKRTGYRYSRRFTLKPGLYQIRVGAREVNTDRIGTGWASVEVPNLARKKLTLSSILLLDSSADRPTSSAKAAMGPVSSRFVQGIRFYRKADFLTYYFRIYCDPAKATPEADLQMQAGIFQGEKAAAQGSWQPVSARLLGKDKKSIAAGEEIKLGNLDAGVYELRIFVKDSASKRTVSQSVVFGVDT